MRNLQDMIFKTNESLQELANDFSESQQTVNKVKREFMESQGHLQSLTDVRDAHTRMEQLFGDQLAKLHPEFFIVLEEFKIKTNTLSQQLDEMMRNLTIRKKMVSDTQNALETLASNREALLREQRQAEQQFLQAQKELSKKIKESDPEDLPLDLALKLTAATRLSKFVKSIFIRSPFFQDDLRFRMGFKPTECSNCFANNSALFILHCGHGPFCNFCIDKFKQTCSNCRQKFESYKPVDSAIFDSKFFPK
jgi:hypothetical protein